MKSIAPFFIIALSVGFYFLYISPNLLEINDLKMQRDQYLDVLDKTKELKVSRDAALADYNNISIDDINRLNKIVPKEFNAVFFANDLSAMASRHGLIIKKFDVAKSVSDSIDPSLVSDSKSFYKTNTISLDLSGGYEQFVQFLKDLEVSLQLSDVGKLSIKSGASQKSEA